MSKPRTPTSVATGARTWLATTRSGRRFAFSATSPEDASRRADHEAGDVDTIRPYLEAAR